MQGMGNKDRSLTHLALDHQPPGKHLSVGLFKKKKIDVWKQRLKFMTFKTMTLQQFSEFLQNIA